MNLSILIVTYNSAKLIGRLLDHLAKELQGLAAEVIVITTPRATTPPNWWRSATPGSS